MHIEQAEFLHNMYASNDNTKIQQQQEINWVTEYRRSNRHMYYLVALRKGITLYDILCSRQMLYALNSDKIQHVKQSKQESWYDRR